MRRQYLANKVALPSLKVRSWQLTPRKSVPPGWSLWRVVVRGSVSPLGQGTRLCSRHTCPLWWGDEGTSMDLAVLRGLDLISDSTASCQSNSGQTLNLLESHSPHSSNFCSDSHSCSNSLGLSKICICPWGCSMQVLNQLKISAGSS